MKAFNSNSVLFYGDARNHVITWDDKQVDHYPRVKILNLDNFNNYGLGIDEEKTWGNKHTFTPGGEEKGRGSVATLENSNMKNECYTTSELFEWLIHIKKKPATNKIYFTTITKNANFYPQGPLTEQEIAEGCFRPDNIVGSLAIYSPYRNHVIGDLNHMAGKVGHIPAPYVIMPDASRVKCDMYFEESWLVIEIPLDIYNNWDWKNDLPLDPTFGYSTVGGSNDNNGTPSSKLFDIFSTSPSGTLTGLSYYMYSGSTSNAITTGYYEGDSLSSLNRVFYDTAGLALPTSWGWVTITTNNEAITAKNYAAIGFAPKGDYWVYSKYDYFASGMRTKGTDWVNSLDLTYNTSTYNMVYTQYATYTAAASSSIKKYYSVAQASIKKADSVAIASIKKISSVANA